MQQRMRNRLAMTVGLAVFLGWMAGQGAARAESPPLTAPASSASNVVLDTSSFWRCHVTFREPVALEGGQVVQKPVRKPGEMKWNSALPPADWMRPEFDDNGWWRSPGPFYGGYGFYMKDGEIKPNSVALICVRGKFLVPDPAKVKGLTLSCSYRGGLVVHVNGQEVKRGDLPAGALGLDALALPYPIEAYAKTDGVSSIAWYPGDQARYQDRLKMRIREVKDVTIPASTLKAGVNVLAIEIHRAPFAEGALKLKESWNGFQCHAGLCGLQLRTDSPAAVQGSLRRGSGIEVWNASPLMAVFDLDYGTPGEPLCPIRLTGARNGWFSGQVVVGGDAPVKGLKVEISGLSGSGGETITASAVQVRFAKPVGMEEETDLRYGTAEVRRFDRLEESAPTEVPVYQKKKGPKPSGAVQPVWVTVHVPATAAAGLYTGRLVLRADGLKDTAVPVELTVADWTLPDPKDNVTFVDMVQSPESVAMHYGVPLWSEQHWALMEKTFQQLARVGNKTVYIPVICKTHFGNSEGMVRWVRKPVNSDRSSVNSDYSADFTVMDRYLDLAQKYLGKPEVVCFYVWDMFCGGGYFNPNSFDRSKVQAVPVSLLDPASGTVTMLQGPTYFDPQAKEFFKPVADGILERMKKRGLEKSVMLGIANDVRPSKEITGLWQELLPDARWVVQNHSHVLEINKVKVGYCATVWEAMWAQDPELGVRREFVYGWRRDAHPLKNGGQPFVQFNRDMTFRQTLSEHRLLAERNISAVTAGFGRSGADFFPPFTDKDGRKHGILANRFPESDVKQLSLKTCLLAPGPDGALSTVRWEMIIEGVQESEARIFIEKALLDKAARAKLGEAKAVALQTMLDERSRIALLGFQNHGWYVSSGWQEGSAALYATAAEVAKALQ